jgi:zeaxanthin glucosyltransferase
MARIVIFVPSLLGTINTIRKVAKDLRANGHTVFFAGLPYSKEMLEGEPFFSVFSSFCQALNDAITQENPSSLFHKYRLERKKGLHYRELIASLVKGCNEGFEEVIEDCQPDLVLIPSASWYAIVWALLAHRFKVPILYFNDSFWIAENSLVPPVRSGLQALMGITGAPRVWLAWKIHNTRKHLREWRERILSNIDYRGLVKSLASAVDFPAELLTQDDQFLRTDALELVLMPQAFDFPHFKRPQRQYCSASVDLTRPECAFPWERLNPNLPVIYCALGTLKALKPKEYIHFYQCVIQAFKPFSREYQLVLCVGKTIDPAMISTVQNVIIAREAPQIALLKRSALMINHAGAGSVKECITLGVPMLLYPLAFDQFGVAARAAFYGVGIKADIRNVTVPGIAASIRKLLTLPAYKMQVKRMQMEFAKAEENSCASKMIAPFLLNSRLKSEVSVRANR